MPLIITDLSNLNEKLLSSLTVKDRVVVLSGKDGSVPISLLSAISSSKAKIEFSEVKDSAFSDPFWMGVEFGKISASAKTGEDVKILYSPSGAKPAPAPRKKKTPAAAPAQEAAVTKSNPSEDLPINKPAAEQETKADASPAKSAETIGNSVKKAVSKTEKMVQKAFADQGYSAFILDGISTAIERASDKEVGLPFQIKLNAGLDMAGELLERAKSVFDKVHKEG